MRCIKSLSLNGKLNALTIDVEDWFQVANLRKVISYEDWDLCESRISYTIPKILRLLSKNNTKATFFILGWIAEKKPEVVQIIQNEGHEIATHGYSHRCVYELTPDDFKQDIKNSIEILKNITGQKVLGYRAPNYSIKPDTTWAWHILSQLGIQYDSSVFPVKHNRYGFQSAPRFPFVINLNENGKMIEFPLSTVKFLRSNIPVAGGAYLRLFPYWFIHAGIKRLNARGNPAIIYFHPWEVDVFQPRIKIDTLSKFKHYGNLLATEKKLEKLLNDFKFAPIRDVLGLRST